MRACMILLPPECSSLPEQPGPAPIRASAGIRPWRRAASQHADPGQDEPGQQELSITR